MRSNRRKSPSAAPGSQRIQSFVEQLADAVLVVGTASGVVAACNASAEILFGYPAEELVGRTLASLHEDRLPGAAADETAPATCRIRIRRAGGEVVGARQRVLPMRGEGGAAWLFVVISDAGQVDDAAGDAGAAAALKDLAQRFGWDYAELWSPQNGRLAFGSYWARAETTWIRRFVELSREMQFDAGVGLPGRAWLTDTPEWLPRVDEAPAAIFRRGFAAKNTGLTSWLSVPCSVHGLVSQVIVFATESPRTREAWLLESLREACDDAVRRLTESGSLRSPADRAGAIESLFFSCPAPIWLLDPLSLAIVDLNEAAADLTGHRRDQLLGKNAGRLLGADPRSTLAACPQDESSKSTCQLTLQLKTASSGSVDCTVTCLRFHDSGRELIAITANTGETPTASRLVVSQRIESLTPRERQVLELVVSGLSNREIAARLGISQRTVETHRASMMRRMHVRSLGQLVALLGSDGEGNRDWPAIRERVRKSR